MSLQAVANSMSFGSNTHMGRFGDTLRRLRDSKHLTQDALGEMVGVTGKRVWDWEQLDSPNIRGTNYKKLAEALGLTTDQLDREWRARKIPQTVGDPGRRGLPIINKAPAGNIVDYNECGVDSGQGRWYIDREGIDDPNAFVVAVTGDSMSPKLMDGDLAIFSPVDSDGKTHFRRLPVPDGHVVFVRFGSDAPCEGCTIACYHRGEGDTVTLRKLNKKYKALECKAGDIVRLAALIRTIRDDMPGATPMHFARENHANGHEGQVHPDYDGSQ